VSHVRKPLVAAAALNTAIFAVEGIAGLHGHSLSLVADAAHNFSDELALVCLTLAYIVPVGMSRNFQRSANLLNSVGLLVVCAMIAGQAFDRALNPAPVSGLLPIVVGVLSAAANGGVAHMLGRVRHMSAAIRLAYLHNLGDVYVSMAPVAAGILVMAFGWSVVDAFVGAGLAAWIAWGTIQEVRTSAQTLLWPENAVCLHEPDDVAHAVPA